MPTRAARRHPRVHRSAAIALTLLFAHCSAQQSRDEPALEDDRDVAVEVRRVLLDPSTHNPIVLLEEREGSRTLPIWIGEAEAQSIAVELGNVQWPRPNTHDLAKRLLASLEATVERVVVTELRGDTYFAVLVIRAGGKRVEIDARPSDAIAIALRVEAPVFVRDALLEKSEPSDADPQVAL